MNKNNTTPIEQLAAEYVLGTLDKEERSHISTRRLTDAHLNHAIIQWEQKLSPLNEYVENVEPRKDLLNNILKKLDALTPQPTPETKNNQLTVVDINSIRTKLKRWRLAAVSASAIAASLAVFIVVGGSALSPQDQPFVAVFQADDKQPAFIMSVDLNTRQLTVRPVTAEGQPSGKTYQLWIKADEIGPTPRSLGLLTSIASPIQKQITYDPAIIRNATFGISIEPEGGSPTGAPTGPAIHGRLYPTSI